MHITTRIEGRKDDELLSDLGGNSFPWIVFLDAEGEIVGRHAGSHTVEAFSRTDRNVRRYLDLRKKAAAGDATVELDKAILECTLGLTEFYELEEAVEGRKLSADQQKAVELCRVNAAVAEGLQLARAGSVDDAVEEFVEIYRKGVYPTQNTAGFWYRLALHASKQGDAALLEASIAGIRKAFGPGDERMDKILAVLESKLAELKGASK